jgi:hypothetical protein
MEPNLMRESSIQFMFGSDKETMEKWWTTPKIKPLTPGYEVRDDELGLTETFYETVRYSAPESRVNTHL